MSFIPGAAAAAHLAQSGPDPVDFDILLNGFHRVGVVTGCLVSPQGSPNMTVAVAAGIVENAGTRWTVTASNQTIATADATNPRFDLIVINSSGATTVRAGGVSAQPAFPALSAGDVVLSAIFVTAATTTITSNEIVDKRVLLPSTEAIAIYGDGSDGVINFDGTTTVLGLAPSANTYTLTRDIYLEDGSQLSGSAKIVTGSWKIHCRGTLTIGASATITRPGASGVNNAAGGALSGSGSASGQSGGGGAGGTATTGTAGTAVTNALGGSGGAGGIASGSGTGGGVAGATASNTNGQLPRSLLVALMVSSFLAGAATAFKGGAGGSGGTAVASSVGGGGGAGGGIVWLAVRDLVNNGTISSPGGSGGNGSGSGTGGGGGGGGGGGAIILITGSTSGSGSLSVVGGSGGTPQGAGATGATGSSGAIYQLQN